MSTSTATRRLRPASPAPGPGRLSAVLVASGGAALLAAVTFTVHPGVHASTPAGSAAGDVPTTTYVHTLTPEIEAGGTARIVTGVSADGLLPEGEVELRIGDRVLTRDLEVGTASTGVQLNEPGTVTVHARYLGSDAADASASEPVTITVR